jgi:hypothetical protein
MRRHIYTDTSVFGGCFDPEFRGPSERLFERFIAGTEVRGVPPPGDPDAAGGSVR